LCRACFDGEYPIELPAGNLIGKHVLEGVGKRVAMAADGANGAEHDREPGVDHPEPGVNPLVGSAGGGDALHRP
jgi:amidophosphoribosyltransferase